MPGQPGPALLPSLSSKPNAAHLMPVQDLRFTSDKIRPLFHTGAHYGHSLYELVNSLCVDAAKTIHALPPLEVIWHNGAWCTLSNSRLWCLKAYMGIAGLAHLEVRVRVLPAPPENFAEKNCSQDNGRTVQVVGDEDASRKAHKGTPRERPPSKEKALDATVEGALPGKLAQLAAKDVSGEGDWLGVGVAPAPVPRRVLDASRSEARAAQEGQAEPAKKKAVTKGSHCQVLQQNGADYAIVSMETSAACDAVLRYQRKMQTDNGEPPELPLKMEIAGVVCSIRQHSDRGASDISVSWSHRSKKEKPLAPEDIAVAFDAALAGDMVSRRSLFPATPWSFRRQRGPPAALPPLAGVA